VGVDRHNRPLKEGGTTTGTKEKRGEGEGN